MLRYFDVKFLVFIVASWSSSEKSIRRLIAKEEGKRETEESVV